MSVLGFLFSPTAFFVWGLGLITFLIGPLASKRIANLHLWLMAWVLQRFSIVVTEHNDLLLKSMEFVDLGVERIQFNDASKDFEDPAAALHHWQGFPFAFADEESGVLFDPRHAAIGQRKRQYIDQGLEAIPATNPEWEEHGVHKWMPGVIEIQKGVHELVNLRAVTDIIEGGERAEYPDRVEKLYKLSRTPFQDRESMIRLAMPVIAFFGIFAGLGLLKSQVGGGGGGGSTVSFGSLLLLIGGGGLVGTVREWVDDYGRRELAIAVAKVLLPTLLFVLLLATVGVGMTILVAIVFALGFTFMPVLTLLGRGSSTVGGFLARTVYLKLGLLGYNQPVLEWTQDGYQLRDSTDLDTTVQKWYTLAGKKFGVTFDPREESFGPDVVDHAEIQANDPLLADGGSTADIPSGYKRSTSLTRDKYGAYVPESLNKDSLYLHMGIALNRMTNAATGEKSLRRLVESKEKYGDGEGIGVSDRTLAYLTFGAGLVSFCLGVFVFFL